MLTTATSNLSKIMFQEGRGGEAMLSFDPIGEREFWLQVRLRYTVNNKPRAVELELPGLMHISHNGYPRA